MFKIFEKLKIQSIVIFTQYTDLVIEFEPVIYATDEGDSVELIVVLRSASTTATTVDISTRNGDAIGK